MRCCCRCFFLSLRSGRPQCHSDHPVGNTLTPPTTTKIREKWATFSQLFHQTRYSLEYNQTLLSFFLFQFTYQVAPCIYIFLIWLCVFILILKRLLAIPRRHLVSNLVQHLHLIVFQPKNRHTEKNVLALTVTIRILWSVSVGRGAWCFDHSRYCSAKHTQNGPGDILLSIR